jgi:hypothetical protein
MTINDNENVFYDVNSSHENNKIDSETVTELAFAILEYYKTINIEICSQN